MEIGSIKVLKEDQHINQNFFLTFGASQHRLHVAETFFPCKSHPSICSLTFYTPWKRSTSPPVQMCWFLIGTDSCILRDKNPVSIKNSTFCLSANAVGNLTKLLNMTADGNKTYVSPSEEYFKWVCFLIKCFHFLCTVCLVSAVCSFLTLSGRKSTKYRVKLYDSHSYIVVFNQFDT